MYLLSGLYDTGLDDQEIKENILEGRYRLHWFATNEWLAATNRCIKKLKDPSAHEDFSQLLLEAALELRNYNFTETVKTENILPSALNSPEISHIICGIAEFRQNEKQTEWSYSNGRSGSSDDRSSN